MIIPMKWLHKYRMTDFYSSKEIEIVLTVAINCDSELLNKIIKEKILYNFIIIIIKRSYLI